MSAPDMYDRAKSCAAGGLGGAGVGAAGGPWAALAGFVIGCGVGAYKATGSGPPPAPTQAQLLQQQQPQITTPQIIYQQPGTSGQITTVESPTSLNPAVLIAGLGVVGAILYVLSKKRGR